MSHYERPGQDPEQDPGSHRLCQGEVGGVPGNQRLRAEGQNDQSKSNLKQAVEKLKDVFK